MPAADTFVASVLLDPLICFLACDDPDARVVSYPLLGAASDDDSTEAGPCEGPSWSRGARCRRSQTARYATLSQKRSPTAAQRHVHAPRRRRGAAITVNATRGARPLRPFARGALPPALHPPGAWPTQLQYAEAVDTRFRQLLSSPTKVPELC